MATNPQVPVIDPQAITAAHAALASAPALPDAPGVDKIRELLFGNQMQDYDSSLRRCSRSAFSKGSGTWKGSRRAPLGAWSPRSRSSWNRSPARSARSRNCAPRRTRNWGRGFASSSRDSRSGLARSPTSSPASSGNSPSGSGHESQALRDEVRRRNEDTRATIERMFQELSNVKTDRNLLAGLFVEIARCLNQDTTPRGGKGNGASS